MTENKLFFIGVLFLTIGFLYYGICSYGKNKYQLGLDRGASLLYKQMNTDLRTQLGVHYNPQTRKFQYVESQ